MDYHLVLLAFALTIALPSKAQKPVPGTYLEYELITKRRSKIVNDHSADSIRYGSINHSTLTIEITRITSDAVDLRFKITGHQPVVYTYPGAPIKDDIAYSHDEKLGRLFAYHVRIDPTLESVQLLNRDEISREAYDKTMRSCQLEFLEEAPHVAREYCPVLANGAANNPEVVLMNEVMAEYYPLLLYVSRSLADQDPNFARKLTFYNSPLQSWKINSVTRTYSDEQFFTYQGELMPETPDNVCFRSGAVQFGKIEPERCSKFRVTKVYPVDLHGDFRMKIEKSSGLIWSYHEYFEYSPADERTDGYQGHRKLEFTLKYYSLP